MDISKISIGKDSPNDVNVIIEIAQGTSLVKYEIDKDSGAVFVDRFMHVAMCYPANYGFIPHTMAQDGDPIDALVLGSVPVIPGAVIRCRPVGVLVMEDEKGMDEKLLMLPVDKLNPFYENVEDYKDLPSYILEQINHFFTHYKDMEKGKWVKIIGYKDAKTAKELITKYTE